jgi:hypothetical protein
LQNSKITDDNDKLLLNRVNGAKGFTVTSTRFVPRIVLSRGRAKPAWQGWFRVLVDRIGSPGHMSGIWNL